MRRNGYQNAVLTAIAVLLALGLVERHSGTTVTEPAAASAQPGDADQGGMTNRLEQGKLQIAELRAISAKLDRLESKLSAGINVKVTSMPPIQVNGAEKREKNKGGEDAPAPVVQPSAPKSPAGK